MKKLISLLAVIAMVTVLATATFATETAAPELVIEDITSAAGEEIVVNLAVVNNPGMTMFEGVISFDTTAFDFVALEAVGGEGWDWMCMVNDKTDSAKFGNIAASAGSDPLTGDCTLIKLTLKVKADVKPGKYEVKFVTSVFGDDEADFIAAGTEIIGYVVIPCTEHVWDEGTVKTPATCTEAGVMEYKCIYCDATKEEAIEATGHTWVETERVEATGCTAGKVVYTCSVCGETKEEALAASGEHTWAETERVEATCCENGKVVYTCSICGETKEETLAATGEHALTYVAVDDKDHKVICGNSGKELGVEAHTFGEWIEDTENPGWKYQLCEKCQHKLIDESGKTGDNSVVAVAMATLSMMGIALVVSKKKEF